MFKNFTSKIASLNVRSWGGKIATSALMMVAMVMFAQSAQASGTKQIYQNEAGHSWNKVVSVDWTTQKIVVICNKSTLTNSTNNVSQLIGVCPNVTTDSNYKIDWAGKGATLVYRNNIMYSWNSDGGDVKQATPNSSLWNSDVYTFEFIKGEGVKFNGTTIMNATNAHTSTWTSSMKVGSDSGGSCGGDFTIKVVSFNATDAEITSVIPAGERVTNVVEEFDNTTNGGWNVTASNIDWTTEKFVISVNDNGFGNGKEVLGFNVPGASNDSENGDIGWGRKKSICMTCSSTTGLKVESFSNLWTKTYDKTIQNNNNKYLIEISSDGVYVNGQVAIPSTNTQFAEMLNHNSLKFGCTNNQVAYHCYYFRRENKVAVDDVSKIVYQGRTIKTLTGQLNVNVQLDRTLSSEYWNTFCVPFNIDAATITSKFGEGTQIRTYGSMEGTTMNFVAATSIEAGKPYLIKPVNTTPATDSETLTFEGVDIVAGDPTAMGTDYQMVGTYGLHTLTTDGTNLFLGAEDKFYKPETEATATMKGMRAYFVVPAGTSETSLVANIDGVLNSIDQIDGGAKVVENPNAPVYNLNGQRVGNSLQGLSRGIYVQNGKKYVVK